MGSTAILKARRVSGGAVVRVLRDGHERRHQVSLRRYNRLLDTLVAHRSISGDFRRHGIDVVIHNVSGLNEARKWAARCGNPRGKHWR